MPQDVAEPDQDRKRDTAELEVVGELLEVDGPRRVLGGMDQDVPLLGDGEVAFAPPFELVELVRVADGKDLTRLPLTRAGRGTAHATIIQRFSWYASIAR